MLVKSGFKIIHNGAPYCEIWLRSDPPAMAASREPNVSLRTIPFGALLGVIRFDGEGADRRGQLIQPGLYTLRYGIMPMNESHQGAALQRDFLLMVPAGQDPDPITAPKFDALVEMSKRASLTAHPAVLSVWRADADAPGFSQRGEDWVLQTTLGDTPIAIILIGTSGA